MILSCFNVAGIGVELYQQTKEYEQCLNLKGKTLWDRRQKHVIFFKLPFVQNYQEKIFSAKEDYEKKGDNIAITSNQIFSPWLKEEIIQPKKKQIEKEIENHLTATPESALRTVGHEKMRLWSSEAYAFRMKSADTSESLSCSMYAIDVLTLQITAKSILQDTNQRFPLMNNIGDSFRMLCSVRSVYENIAWLVSPIDSSLQDSRVWKIKLFRDIPLGYYWVQFDLKRSTLTPTEYVCAAHIFKDQRKCNNLS